MSQRAVFRAFCNIFRTTLCVLVSCFVFSGASFADFNIPTFTSTVYWVCPDGSSTSESSSDITQIPTIKSKCLNHSVSLLDKRNMWYCMTRTGLVDGEKRTYLEGENHSFSSGVTSTIVSCYVANIVGVAGVGNAFWTVNYNKPATSGSSVESYFDIVDPYCGEGVTCDNFASLQYWKYSDQNGDSLLHSSLLTSFMNIGIRFFEMFNNANNKTWNTNWFIDEGNFNDLSKFYTLTPTMTYLRGGPHISLYCPNLNKSVETVAVEGSISNEVAMTAGYDLCSNGITTGSPYNRNNAEIWCKNKDLGGDFVKLDVGSSLCGGGITRSLSSNACYDWQCEIRQYKVHFKNVVATDIIRTKARCHDDGFSGAILLDDNLYYLSSQGYENAFKLFRSGYRFRGWCVYDAETSNGQNCAEDSANFVAAVVELCDSHETNVNIVAPNSTGDKWVYAKWEPINYSIAYDTDEGECSADDHTGPNLLSVQPATFTIANNNGITLTSDGQGTYKLTGTTASDGALLEIPVNTFTIPKSSDGYLVLNNSLDIPDGELRFYEDSELVDNWVLTPRNRAATYTKMAQRVSNKIAVYIPKETDLTTSGGLTITPAVYNDGRRTAGTFVPGVAYENKCYPVVYNIESADITLPIPAKEGYLFKGWCDTDTAGCTPFSTIPQGSFGNKTLYAQWDEAGCNKDDTVASVGEPVISEDGFITCPNVVCADGYSKTGYTNTDGVNEATAFNVTGAHGEATVNISCKPRTYHVVLDTEPDDDVPAEYWYVYKKKTTISGVNYYYWKEEITSASDMIADNGWKEADYRAVSEKRGYTFDGYWTTAEATTGDKRYIDTNGERKNNIYANGTTGQDTSNTITLYARWNLICNISCNPGQYLPADGIECADCPVGSFCEGTETDEPWCYNEFTDQGKKSCATEMFNNSATTSDFRSTSITDCYVPCEDMDVDDAGNALIAVDDIDYYVGYDPRKDKCEYIVDFQYRKKSTDTSCNVSSCCPYETQTVNDEDGYNRLEICTPDDADVCDPGKYFDKWNLQEISLDEDDPTKNIVVYTPNCKNATYTIHYVLNNGQCSGGECIPKQYTYEAGVAATDMPAPIRDGYVFDGWYDNPELTGTKVESIKTTDYGDKTLYAKWNAICAAGKYLPKKSLECKICPAVSDGQGYYCTGGTYPYNEDTDQGKTACVPGYPHSIEGQKNNEFCNIDFYFYPGAGTTFIGRSYSTESDKLAVPQFYKKDSAFFEFYISDGGTHYLSSPLYQSGLNAPQKPGYDFNGWLLQKHNVEGDQHQGDVLESECRAVGLARDTDCDENNNDCHNRGCRPQPGATPCPGDFWYLGGLCIPPSKLVDDDSGPKTVDVTTPVTSGGQRNLYAKWTIIEYTITYDADGGTCDVDNHSENLLSYQPNGWKTSRSSVTITSNGNGQYTINGTADADTRLLIPINEIVIPYAVNAGNEPKGAGVLALNNATAANGVLFQFNWGGRSGGVQWTDGWELDSTNKFVNDWKSGKIGDVEQPGGKRANNIAIYVPKDTVLNNVVIKPALYNDFRTSAGTFAAGPTFGCAEQTYTIESEDIILPTPTKEGYTFAGWWTNDNKQMTKVPAGTSKYIHLFARWTPQKATVNFVCSPTYTRQITDKLLGESIYWPTESECNDTETDTWACSGGSWDVIREPNSTDNEILGLIPRSVTPITCKSGYRIEYRNPPHDPLDSLEDTEIRVNDQPLNPRAYTSENRVYYPSEKTMNNLPIGAAAGYKFLGWYTDTELTHRVDRLAVGSSGNKIVYAKWTTIPKCNKGDGVETTEAFIKDDIVKCHVTCKDGYSKNGYHDTTMTFDTNEITQDTTVNCEARTYKVNFDPRHYASADSDVTANSPTTTGTTTVWYRYNQFIPDPDKTVPNTGCTCEDSQYAYPSTKLSQECYYYKTDIRSAEDETMDNCVFRGASSNTCTRACYPYIAIDTKPKYTGYTFGGYYSGKAGSGTWYTNEYGTFVNNIYATLPTDADKVLDSTGTSRTVYAKWTPTRSYIQLNSQVANSINDSSWTLVDGTPNVYSREYNIESPEIVLPIPVVLGKDFGGWYGNADYTGTAVTSVPAGSSGFKNYFAKWTPKTISCTGGAYIAANSETCAESCPENHFCPAAEYEYTGAEQGKYSCAEDIEGGFTKSDAESAESSACYKDVETQCSSVPQYQCPAHATCDSYDPVSINGRQYYGQDQVDYGEESCVKPTVTACADGWILNTTDNTCDKHIKYKVKFMRCGASVVSPMGTLPNTGYIEYGTEHNHVLPDAAHTSYSKTNYTFTQWCKAKQVNSNTSVCDGDDRFDVGASTDVLVDDDMANEGTINVCPDWQPEDYTIHYYNYMDDDMVLESALYPQMEHYNVSTPSPKTLKSDVETVFGYEFKGWCAYNEQQSDIETASNCNDDEVISELTFDADNIHDKYMYAKWAPKTISCAGGVYIAANSEICEEPCPRNHYCPAADYEYTGAEQGKYSCAIETENVFVRAEPGSVAKTACYKKCHRDNARAVEPTVYWSDETEEQNDCEYIFNCDSDKWLHVGSDEADKMCLYENKPNGPVLGVRIGTEKYYVPLSTDAEVKINTTSRKKLRVRVGSNVYNAYSGN